MEEKDYYFLGAGGIGMSALALALVQKKKVPYGSDRALSDSVKQLQRLGAKIDTPENPKTIKKGMEVIVSTDVPGDHPVLCRARALGLTIKHRSKYLEELTQNYKRLVVTGSHGKTTTTSLLTHLLNYAGWDPAFFLGGKIPGYPVHGYLGGGKYALIEGDESDGSFLRGNSFGSIITSIDNDHLNHWQSMENLQQAFNEFAGKTESKEHLLYCVDDDAGIGASRWKGVGYGFCQKADLQLHDYQPQGSKGICFSLNEYKNIFLPLLGKHNAKNGAAVFGLARALSIQEEIIREAFASFSAPKRRSELLGKKKKALCFSDYGHHPTEVKATLAAFKESYPGKKIALVFQPHRYSRIKNCWEEFQSAFDAVDCLVVTDLYGALEQEESGINGEFFADWIGQRREVRFTPFNQLKGMLDHLTEEVDLLVAMGAGSIDEMFRAYLK